nr:MAG TPA: hypothetical protein [Caudoviricetes sp.]
MKTLKRYFLIISLKKNNIKYIRNYLKTKIKI